MHRDVCLRALKFQAIWEGLRGKAAAANRTWEIRPYGMRGRLAETVGVGTVRITVGVYGYHETKPNLRSLVA